MALSELDRKTADFASLLSGATTKDAKLNALLGVSSIAKLRNQITRVKLGGRISTFTTTVSEHWKTRGGPKRYLVVVVEPATLKETLQKELLSLLEAMENDSILGEMKWGSVTEFLMVIFGTSTTLRKSPFEI